MTKKRLFIASALLMSFAVAGSVIVLMTPDNRPGVTRTNFSRVQIGMTLKEVYVVLGPQTDSYIDPTPVDSTYFWNGPEGSAAVGIHNRQVYKTEWTDAPGSWRARIRRAVHLE